MSDARSSSATATTGIAESRRRYCGRFAPTPSGPLHFGSLVAAVGSYLDARANGGLWLVRIEDLDPPRERPGAAADILTTLDRLGLEWDGEVWHQSRRSAAYEAALAQLGMAGQLRTCRCSRAQLAALPENRLHCSGEELFHPIDCLDAAVGGNGPAALRLRVPDRAVQFLDRVQGAQSCNVARTVGDFVLRRRDGLFAYQLAVVVDDAAQGVTDVVRGCDLLGSTARQIVLQEQLDLPRLTYMHLPIAVGGTGIKLSKSQDAPGLSHSAPATRVVAALEFLRQGPPAGLARESLTDVWHWAIAHWQPQRFAGMTDRRIDTVPDAHATTESSSP